MRRVADAPFRWERIDWWIAALLFVGVALLFARAVTCDFVNYDDPGYVTENSWACSGLNFASVKWAFTGTHGANWHPLTSLSHLIDAELYGINPAGHHATSVVIHALNCPALYLVLRYLTGHVWPSAAVAAFFGFHPLHVESVAWVSERKDVLSTLFWILAIGAYGAYARSVGRRRKSAWYAALLALFVCGLASKPMVVTLPFVLLLLDYWPLKRMDPLKRGNLASLVVEKIPLLVLAAAASIATYHIQRQWGAFSSGGEFGFTSRAANAVLSYGFYLTKLIWPIDLAVYYPFPTEIPALTVVAWTFLLLAATVAAAALFRPRPCLFVGWFWFLGTLVPVIGLIQVGTQAFADRYSYIPSIGAFLIAAWGVADLRERFRISRAHLATLTVLALAAAGACTWVQIGFWRNNYTLYLQALRVNSEGCTPNHNLAEALAKDGRVAEAIHYYREAIRIAPKRVDIRSDLAMQLFKIGDIPGSLEQYDEVVRLQPHAARAHFQLARALVAASDAERAVVHYRKALELWPDRLEVLMDLAALYATRNAPLGNPAEAARLAQRALELGGPNAFTLEILAEAHAKAGRFEEAITAAKRAVLAAKDEQTKLRLERKLESYERILMHP